MAELEGVCEYLVEGAGVPEVNGCFARLDELKNGAPCFQNECGTQLFRFIMASGAAFWYFSRGGCNVNSSLNDYYRVKSTELSPPCTGWTTTACQLGRGSSPVVLQCSTAGIPTSAAPGSPSCSDVSHHPETSTELQLDVHLLSGAKLTTLRAEDSWTARQVKDALRLLVPQGRYISAVLCGAQVLENSETLREFGLPEAAVLQVALQECEYLVEGAGAPQVNGWYSRTEEEMNGAPCFMNDNGTLLFHHVMPRGTRYWYFSRAGENLNSDASDFYRVRTAELVPPRRGWTSDHCRLGLDGVPTVISTRRDDVPECGSVERDGNSGQ